MEVTEWVTGIRVPSHIWDAEAALSFHYFSMDYFSITEVQSKFWTDLSPLPKASHKKHTYSELQLERTARRSSLRNGAALWLSGAALCRYSPPSPCPFPVEPRRSMVRREGRDRWSPLLLYISGNAFHPTEYHVFGTKYILWWNLTLSWSYNTVRTWELASVLFWYHLLYPLRGLFLMYLCLSHSTLHRKWKLWFSISCTSVPPHFLLSNSSINVLDKTER